MVVHSKEPALSLSKETPQPVAANIQSETAVRSLPHRPPAPRADRDPESHQGSLLKRRIDPGLSGQPTTSCLV